MRKHPKSYIGATMVEMGLIISLICMVGIVAVRFAGKSAKCRMYQAGYARNIQAIGTGSYMAKSGPHCTTWSNSPEAIIWVINMLCQWDYCGY